MKRITIIIDDKALKELESLVKNEGMTKSSAIRIAIGILHREKFPDPKDKFINTNNEIHYD